MNDNSYHTVSSIINAFKKSVNFPFKCILQAIYSIGYWTSKSSIGNPSTLFSMELILLINVKMSTNVGILTFISRLNTPSENFKQEPISTFRALVIIHVQFS